MSCIIHIAVPGPFRKLFDYVSDEDPTAWRTGMRVSVDFGNRPCVGIVMGADPCRTDSDASSLKPVKQRLDDTALIPDELMQTLVWVSRYYHHPLGDCFQSALPKSLRSTASADLAQETWWTLIQPDTADLKIGSKQQQILDLLNAQNEGLSQSAIKQQLGNVTASLKSLQQKGVITARSHPALPQKTSRLTPHCTLNDEQQHVVEQIWQQREQFSPCLLQGITGSGKTEVYIELARRQCAQGKQVLILIPEIGLTGQFVSRFRQQLNASIVVLNSSISDGERKQGWLLAKSGLADVIIGTRSAVFTPLASPGLILIDEEHDASYKQQDGLRYHARNIALMRARAMAVPIVLGSATPSLESLYQVQIGRYRLLTLTRRAGGAAEPKVRIVDSSQAHPDHGLSQPLLTAMHTHLEAGNQVILFINRRGYAPVLMCHACGWQATCRHCDARMVVHRHRQCLFCHHCGLIQKLIEQCPECESTDLKSYGAGTEKIESVLHTLFDGVPVLRIDRDTTQRVAAFSDIIDEIHRGEPRILVGTQMLAKGHDFHDVTLVGVLDTDQGLYSADYRATENLAQLIVQVTGRAGRGSKAGEVLIQSDQPQHPFWRQLLSKGYGAAAQALLQQRCEMGMPPAAFWIVIRAEARDASLAGEFLQQVQALLATTAENEVMLLGPVPAVMERKAGRYRAQLLLTSQQRKPLHRMLDQHIDAIAALKLTRKVRWSIDVDPLDLV